MTDQPYGLDFFQQITDVHFGAQWLAINPSFIASKLGQTGTCTIDFPDQAGGTPGFIPMTAIKFGIPPVIFAPYVNTSKTQSTPYTITAADLQRTLRTNAGAPITGFAIARVNAAAGMIFLLKLDKNLPSSPFRVRCTATGSLPPGLQVVTIFTIKRNAMKAGLTFTQSFDLPFESIVVNADLPPNVPKDFRINPQTLAVTAG